MGSFTSLGISQFYCDISLRIIINPSVNLAKQLKAGTAGQCNSLFFVLNYGGRKSRHYKATLKGRDMSRISSSWLVIAAQCPDFDLLRRLPRLGKAPNSTSHVPFLALFCRLLCQHPAALACSCTPPGTVTKRLRGQAFVGPNKQNGEISKLIFQRD